MITEPFTTTSGDYMKCLLALWLPRYGWWLPVILAVFTGIGVTIGDVRYLIIALIIIFVGCPMLMSRLYIYYMLTPEARRAVLRKQVEIIENRQLTLTYLPVDEDDDHRLPQQFRGAKSKQSCASERFASTSSALRGCHSFSSLIAP